MLGLGKRQMERFKLDVPAIITPKNRKESHRKRQLELRTRNICAGGAFILTDTPLDVGTDVDVNLQLTFFTGSAEHEKRSIIHISGSVIRTEPRGMAVKFKDKYQISPHAQNT